MRFLFLLLVIAGLPWAGADFGCYYEMDHKYSDLQDDAEIENWWKAKIELIKVEGIQNDIWSTGGGGPNGAEWNTYTDLYFVAIFPRSEVSNLDSAKLDQWEFSLYINDVLERGKKVHVEKYEGGVLVSVMLEKEYWESKLREIIPADHIPLYGEQELAGPPDVGKVFKIEIVAQTQDLNKYNKAKYFHLATGE